MFRKSVSFVLGLALIVALGLAIARAEALKASASLRVSVPCEPASPGIKTPAGESVVVLTVEASFATESLNLPAAVARRSQIEMVARAISPPAPLAFPPLLHRPPPTNA
jgi:hypothetical protein